MTVGNCLYCCDYCFFVKKKFIYIDFILSLMPKIFYRLKNRGQDNDKQHDVPESGFRSMFQNYFSEIAAQDANAYQKRNED